MFVVGNSGVGKSCFLLRLVRDSFTTHHINTIGLDIVSTMQAVKPLELSNQTANLQFWDTAGGERFRLSIRDKFRDADGFMIIYDVTDRSSFESLPMWVDYIKAAPDRARLVIVGNKSDLHYQRQVSFEEGKAFADTAGAPFIESSAKTSANVQAAVLSLAWELKAKADEHMS